MEINSCVDFSSGKETVSKQSLYPEDLGYSGGGLV